MRIDIIGGQRQLWVGNVPVPPQHIVFLGAEPLQKRNIKIIIIELTAENLRHFF